MPSVFLILPTRLLSLSAFWVVTTKGRMHDEYRLKACHYKSGARVLVRPCCDSQACFIQPPTLCTCHLQLRPPSRLTSEEAGYTPTCPEGCDQLDEQTCPSMQLLWLGVATQDPRLSVGSHEGQTGSTRCLICVLLHLTAVFLSVPATEHHHRLPLQCARYSLTCTLAKARQPLWLLWQTGTEIAPQIDPSSGSQGTSSPTSVRSCLLFFMPWAKTSQLKTTGKSNLELALTKCIKGANTCMHKYILLWKRVDFRSLQLPVNNTIWKSAVPNDRLAAQLDSCAHATLCPAASRG